jgi:beta-lactamase regulating signal transducer with metallopeptidase domain
VVTVVVLLQFLLKKQLPPAWRHALWFLVLIRLLIPVYPESKASLFTFVNLELSRERTAVAAPASGEPVESASEITSVAASSPAQAAPLSYRTVLAMVWGAGVVALPVYLLAANWRLGRRIRDQRPITDTAILNLLEDCKEAIGVRVPLPVLETAAATSPSIFGFIRPRLLLPAGFSQAFTLEELRYVFLHELGHIKRHDILLRWLTTTALVLHWFNPIIWFAANRMRSDGELACDALALSRTRANESQGYGRTIIKLLEHFSRPTATPALVGILEDKNHMKRRINMIATFGKRNGSPWLAAALFATLACLTLSNPRTSRAAGEPGNTQGPPKIVSTKPELGDTEVDPALTEITITFDRDMAGGFSWTGGPPDFPPAPEGKKPAWLDKRTCVLPVKLEAARYYRVGINSTSFHNFKSVDQVPAQPSAIYFTTKGASDALKRKATKPMIVEINPKNGARDVDPGLTELRVTFNVPMGPGFSWTGGPPEFPPMPEGKKPSWSADHKTCILPVSLQPGTTYRLGLNSPSHKNFQSAGGVPLDPIVYGFTTRN